MEHRRHSKKRNRKSTCREILFEYLSQSQVNGYRFIVQTNRPLYERLLWILITTFCVLITFTLIINSYEQFLESPTVTSEHPISTSILELGFPSVGVCNANRISRKALWKYSKFILNATKYQRLNIGRSVDEVFENLAKIGQMYTLESNEEDKHKMQLIHSVLSEVYGGSYPVKDILSKLTPNCNDTLKACKWLGHDVECYEIFKTRKTFMGSCCLFNYQRPVVSILTTQQEFNRTIPTFDKPERVNSYGFYFGLTFLVDHQSNDYVFTMNDYTGIAVLISDAYDYPDQESGAVRGKIVAPQQESFITLHPTLIRGSKSMKSFNISSRNCVFDDEINLVFSNFYSLSECLLTCRIISVIEYCGCTPPQVTNLFNSTACMFKDLECLHNWRKDFYNFEGALTDDANNNCTECVPKCTRLQYMVHASESHIDLEEANKFEYFRNFTNLSDHSLVFVNFGSNKVANFDQTATYVWYELLATLGSVASLSLGATMVSIIEVIYFFSGKLGAIWTWKRFRNVARSRFDYVN